MTSSEPRVFDLNISENYVPEWGPWEVAREVISNAIDADRKGYKVEMVGPDKIIVRTRTAPTLAQIKFIGGGTKTNSTNTIGVFGEGIKLAAMVAKRLGGDMTMRFGRYDVRYELVHHEDLGQRCANMIVTDVEKEYEGMDVEISVPGIAAASSGRFLDSQAAAMLEKRDPTKLLIYNKGVYIAEKPCHSIWDWNLSTTVNRDRNMVDSWEVGANIRQIFNEFCTQEDARKVIDHPGSFEMTCFKQSILYLGSRTARAFNNAVLDKYGIDAVLASDDVTANQVAQRLGKNVLLVDGTIREIIAILQPEERVKFAHEVVTLSDHFEPIDKNTYPKELAELHEIADILDQTCEIQVFNGALTNVLGAAEGRGGLRRVLLSSELFQPGQKTARFGTFVHELAHLNSKGNDATLKFEDELTRFCGVLAKRLI